MLENWDWSLWRTLAPQISEAPCAATKSGAPVPPPIGAIVVEPPPVPQKHHAQYNCTGHTPKSRLRWSQHGLLVCQSVVHSIG